MVCITDTKAGFSAGGGRYAEDHLLHIGVRPFSKKWLTSKGLQVDRLSLGRVDGDSMEPILKNTDIVMIDHRQTKPTAKLFTAFRLDGEIYIKLFTPTDDDKYTFSSLNTIYHFFKLKYNIPPHGD